MVIFLGFFLSDELCEGIKTPMLFLDEKELAPSRQMTEILVLILVNAIVWNCMEMFACFLNFMMMDYYDGMLWNQSIDDEWVR